MQEPLNIKNLLHEEVSKASLSSSKQSQVNLVQYSRGSHLHGKRINNEEASVRQAIEDIFKDENIEVLKEKFISFALTRWNGTISDIPDGIFMNGIFPAFFKGFTICGLDYRTEENQGKETTPSLENFNDCFLDKENERVVMSLHRKCYFIKIAAHSEGTERCYLVNISGTVLTITVSEEQSQAWEIFKKNPTKKNISGLIKTSELPETFSLDPIFEFQIHLESNLAVDEFNLELDSFSFSCVKPDGESFEERSKLEDKNFISSEKFLEKTKTWPESRWNNFIETRKEKLIENLEKFFEKTTELSSSHPLKKFCLDQLKAQLSDAITKKEFSTIQKLSQVLGAHETLALLESNAFEEKADFFIEKLWRKTFIASPEKSNPTEPIGLDVENPETIKLLLNQASYKKLEDWASQMAKYHSLATIMKLVNNLLVADKNLSSKNVWPNVWKANLIAALLLEKTEEQQQWHPKLPSRFGIFTKILYSCYVWLKKKISGFVERREVGDRDMETTVSQIPLKPCAWKLHSEPSSSEERFTIFEGETGLTSESRRSCWR